MTGSIQGYRFAANLCSTLLPHFAVKLPNQDPSNLPLASHTNPPSFTELPVIGLLTPQPPLCHHPIPIPTSPCTRHWPAGLTQDRPAVCCPFPLPSPSLPFLTLPPCQLCSLARLGAAIVRRGYVRQGVTSHQRTTRGALTTAPKAPWPPFRYVPSSCQTLSFSLFPPPLLLAPDSWNSLQLSRLARINWAVYSEEGESSPAADKTALDDDILIGLSYTFVSLLGSHWVLFVESCGLRYSYHLIVLRFFRLYL